MAGTIRNTLVVTLPGSVKAVRENMEVLLTDGMISHAIELIRGGSGQATHATLASSDVSAQGHSHRRHDDHHHHHHHHGHGHHHHSHDHEIPRPRTVLTQDTTAPGKLLCLIVLHHQCYHYAVSARQRQSPFPILSFDQAMELILGKISPLAKEILPVSA